MCKYTKQSKKYYLWLVFLPAIYVNLTGKFHLVIHTLVFWLRSGWLILFFKKYKKILRI